MTKNENLSVLLVDNDIHLRDTLAEVFERFGFNVYPAGSGAEAIDIVQSEPVDFGLFDFHMPDITGVELFVEIQQQSSSTLPTVLMTSDQSEEISLLVTEHGIYQVIYKPFDVHPLEQVINSMIKYYFGDQQQLP